VGDDDSQNHMEPVTVRTSLGTAACVLGLLTTAPSLRAQGEVLFANAVSTRISNALTGQPIFGTNAFLFGLYVGPAGATEAQLSLLALATNLPTGSSADTFAGIFAARPISTWVPQQGSSLSVAKAQIRGWSLSAGDTYEVAYAAASRGDQGILLGKSALALIYPEVPPGAPFPLFLPGGPFSGFTVGPIPEPSTAALTLLGAAALVWIGGRIRARNHSGASKNPLITSLLCCVTCLVIPAYGQGIFDLNTATARTRLGSLDGPLAGRGIWGQALVGMTADSLTPVGMPVEHIANGLIAGTGISVPFAEAGTTVFAQLAAWNGAVWGTEFARVPPDQLGHTDIAPVFLSTVLGQKFSPLWSVPAIVPTVPEPSIAFLAISGGLVLLVLSRRR
jgi:hypothetical protein